MTEPVIRDAVGRVVGEGDVVGGTTSGRYQATISGPVLKLGKGRVKVDVERSSRNSCAATVGDQVWIDASRIFLVLKAVKEA